MSSSKARSQPHLSAGEVTLLDLAADDPRDIVSFSDKEATILQLYHQIQEQELEKAILEQELESASTDSAEALADAERELLDARATYTVRKKAVGTVLITDPILKAIHLKGVSPAERALLRLVNRRDVLSLAQENLGEVHNATLKKLSTLEVENVQLHQKNQELVRELLKLTEDDESWREELDDPELKQQLSELEAGYKKSKARWELMKSVTSAIVVGSGVDWADDENLTALVLDESND
ncbi:centromere protein H (CENP-H)-domain-containing protein [Aspergillus pseudodeflectus]|uniref:Centromere protein H (CENP-H)-domain-containing protein n=1 Tax=Aspergillus pseudodeflectus TaxID=176178 RepID=A0ABR4L894_9EURO